MGICVSETLFPTWYFQGIEKMKYITISNVLIRGCFTLLIFIFIRTQSHYWMVPLFNGIGAIIGSIVGLRIVFVKHKIRFSFPKIEALLSFTKASVPFFISKLAAAIGAYTNRLIVGSFIGLSELSYLDLAEKLVTVFKMPNSIINTIVYPRLSLSKDIVVAKKVFNIRLLIGAFLTFMLIFLSKYLVVLLGGVALIDAVNVVRLISIMIFITAISYYTGDTLLNSFGYSRIFNYSVILSTILYLLLIFCLWLFNAIDLYNIVYVSIITEAILALSRYYFCVKYKVLSLSVIPVKNVVLRVKNK